MSKITIVGAGSVGSTAAFSLAENAISDEIVIVDINKNKSLGNALDIAHGLPLLKPVNIYAGDYEDTKNSDIVIITVGVPEVVGESRLIPLQKNTDILKGVIPQLLKYSPNTQILMVSNPVDILTYVAYKISNLPKSKVIGLGTVLDSSRFKYLLGKEFNLDGRCINGYMIGEHGDSQIAAWSKTSIAGGSIEEYCNAIGYELSDDFKDNIEAQVKQTAFDVWEMKGPNCFCVANAIKTVAEAILRNEQTILPISTIIEGEYGIKDVSLSLPSILGKNGVKKVLDLPLGDNELNGFKNSASIMKSLIDQLDI
ncbi:MAG TPA: L-lactate dehydrogenase [Terrisporobacter glycolicus]|uniref:L-lactate dehydrogenase n=1 Tax=Terrisporobacter petrolearius TaxID=1460447 RepID=A0ABZ3F8V5_9FIRM|nr:MULTISPECIES: L-lactate dehydrogenase [Terrisporobacter]MBN9648129.1 L-lactate dehydrogenase [Terrisporobacter glycolicus]HBI92765.1 L-lactate dehydrogenase [Terrisporobacter hibernicus]